MEAPKHRVAAVLEADYGGRGLMVSTYASIREATEDEVTNPGARIIATARPLLTGEWVTVDAGWSAPSPKWPAGA